MKKIARQLEQPTQKEEDIAAIIRGVRAFKPINEGSETETPEEFKPRQLVYLL